MALCVWKSGTALLSGLGILASAFAIFTPQDGPAGKTRESKQPRVAPQNIAEQDLTRFAAANSAFACDLYQALRDEQGNLFFSPYSLSMALAMTWAGARGETAEQMARVLHFEFPPAQLHPLFNALDQGLMVKAKEKSPSRTEPSEPFRLNVANRLWVDQHETLLPAYLDLLAQYYGAGVGLLDFLKQPAQAAQAINQWISQQTQDRIRDLVTPDDVRSAALVLTNAIYFKASWAEQFQKDFTQPDTFHRLDGTKISVPLMFQKATFGHASGAGYQALELPYEGHTTAMLLLVPDAGRFADFEKTLSAARLNEISKSLKSREVVLKLPKFKFSSRFILKDALGRMGMPLAFTNKADFSGMNGKKEDLFIGQVIHQAFVLADETGTEAAAATAVIMTRTSIPVDQPLELTIDRPFLFLIRDLKTGTILFLGRVLDPAVK